MHAYRAIVDKRDQRAFLPTPIPEDALRRVLQADRMTGSSKNSEPNRFVIVRDRARLAAIGGLGAQARRLERAAVGIVFVQTQRHEYDAGRCAQNMMVAAWADGIGSCPAHVPEAEDPAKTAPPRSVARRRLPIEELTHWEEWRA